MSSKELKSYSDSNSLVLNSVTTKSLTASQTSNMQTLIMNQIPDITHFKVTTVYSANAIENPNFAPFAGGVIINKYIAGTFKLNIPSAVSMYSSLPMNQFQCISVLLVNATTNNFILDSLDVGHIQFNSSSYTPVLTPNTSRYALIMFTGTPSVPTYDIFV